MTVDMDSMRQNRKDKVESATVRKLMRFARDSLYKAGLFVSITDQDIVGSALINAESVTKESDGRSYCSRLLSKCHYDAADKPPDGMQRQDGCHPRSNYILAVVDSTFWEFWQRLTRTF